jgi:hypothetical protein
MFWNSPRRTRESACWQLLHGIDFEPSVACCKGHRLVLNRPSIASLIFIGSIPHSPTNRRARRELSWIYHGEVGSGWNRPEALGTLIRSTLLEPEAAAAAGRCRDAE